MIQTLWPPRPRLIGLNPIDSVERADAGTGVICWAEPLRDIVIPAKAGIHFLDTFFFQELLQWIPAFAGMTAISRLNDTSAPMLYLFLCFPN